MQNAPESKSETTQFSLGVLLVVTLFVAIVFAGWRYFGIMGVAPSCALVALLWFTVSRTQTSALYPMNRQRMTWIELLTILAICFILFGLSDSGVQSQPRIRRAVPVVPGPVTPGNVGDAEPAESAP